MGIITDELRWSAAKLIELGKYAVDSAVNEPLRVVTGKSKDQSPWNLSNDTKKQNSVLVEEMQAKLEKLREDVTKGEQQRTISTCLTQENHKCGMEQFFDEPLEISPRNETVRKKIFIRSRL